MISPGNAQYLLKIIYKYTSKTYLLVHAELHNPKILHKQNPTTFD